MTENKTNVILPEGSIPNELEINFVGGNNIVYIEPETKFCVGSKIVLSGSNNLIYISSSVHIYKLNLTVGNGSTVFFGKDNYYNGFLNAVVSEGRNLIIGGGGVFSFNCWIRTADVHLIYDAKNKRRINNAESIIIGDHVWLGQQCLILKGTKIGSGSILAGGSVISKCSLESNTIYGGSPAKKIKEGVFFLNDSSHNFSEKNTKDMEVHNSEKYIYHENKNSVISYCDKKLIEKVDASDKLDVLRDLIINNNDKNRFAILNINESQGNRSGIFNKLLKK